MHCLLEIHSERKVFQYLMDFTLCLIKFISITRIDESDASCTTTSNYPLRGIFI